MRLFLCLAVIGMLNISCKTMDASSGSANVEATKALTAKKAGCDGTSCGSYGCKDKDKDKKAGKIAGKSSCGCGKNKKGS